MASKAFILHLERATARRANVEALRAALPMPSDVVAALDGARLDAAALAAACRRRLHRPFYPFALTPSEIGAFLSHRAAWRRIVDDGLDYGLVFEDDAGVDPAPFAAALGLAEAERARWDYLLLPAAGARIAGEAIAEREGVTLLRPASPPLRAIGQIVSRSAAERLLACAEPFDRPVDTFLQMSWITGVAMHVLIPSGVRDVSSASGGTTIQRKLSALERLRHEIFRPIYRARVRARYRRDAALSGR